MPENTIGGRIDKIIDYFRMNAKQFAMELNISEGHLSDIRHGKRKLFRKVINSIYLNYGINMNWLLTGEGEMLSPQWPLRIAEHSARYGMTARLAEYIEKVKIVYYEGSTEDKARVLGMIDAVHDEILRLKERKAIKYDERKKGNIS